MLANLPAVLPAVPAEASASVVPAPLTPDSAVTPPAFDALLAVATELPAVAVEAAPAEPAPAADTAAPADFPSGRRLPKPQVARRESPPTPPAPETPLPAQAAAPAEEKTDAASLPVSSRALPSEPDPAPEPAPAVADPVFLPSAPVALPLPPVLPALNLPAVPATDPVAFEELPADSAGKSVPATPLLSLDRPAPDIRADSARVAAAPNPVGNDKLDTKAAIHPPALPLSVVPVPVSASAPASLRAAAPAAISENALPSAPREALAPAAPITTQPTETPPAQIAATPFSPAAVAAVSASYKIKNTFQATDKQFDAKHSAADGIVPAVTAAVMTRSPNFSAQSPVTSVAVVPEPSAPSAPPASASAPVPAATTPHFTVTTAAPASASAPAASKAVEAVQIIERVAEAADRLAAQSAGSVTLRIDLADTSRVDIRVSVRGGRVQADFRTDSVEMRQALSAAWTGFAAARAESSVRWAEPVFAALPVSAPAAPQPVAAASAPETSTPATAPAATKIPGPPRHRFSLTRAPPKTASRKNRPPPSCSPGSTTLPATSACSPELPAMSITALNPTSSLSAAEAGRLPKQTLGQEDFLKLITVQLTKQDPLKPMEDTSFMAQMAQFTALEQASGMAKDMAALRSELSLQSASGMIGREVTLNGASGPVSGSVSSVDTSGGTVKIGVNGTYYPLSQVVRVAPAAPAPQAS